MATIMDDPADQTMGELILEDQTTDEHPQQNEHPDFTVIGQLRTHPELRGTQSMTLEQASSPRTYVKQARTNKQQRALATVVAIREFFNCGQPVNQAKDHRGPRGDLLLFEKLRDMVSWVLIRREYCYSEQTVRRRYLEAIEDGGVWFVRWTTDLMLEFFTAGEVSSYVWASHVLVHLSEVMEELESFTMEIDDNVRREGLVEVEGERFNSMVGLLEQIFKYTQVSLQTTHDSKVGIEELLRIVNESDIVLMLTGPNLRLTYANMKRGQRWKYHECFKNISEQLIARLKERRYSLPVNNAVRIMLKVIPKLGDYTLNKIPLQDWYATLKRYGFADNADTLAAAIDNEGSLQSGSATPVSEVSHSMRTPVPILPLDPRPSLLRMSETPSQMSYGEGEEDEEVDDDDEDDLAWDDVRFSNSPFVYPPLDVSQTAPMSDQEEDDDDEEGLDLGDVPVSASPFVYRALDMDQAALTSGGAEGLRASGPTHAYSDRSNSRTPTLELIDQDSHDQSTPRAAKKASMSMEAAESNDHDPFVQLTPSPKRRSPMNMGAIGNALDGVHTGDDSALGAGVIVPTIEWGDPLTQSSPRGSSDEDVFEAGAAAFEDDDNVSPTGEDQSCEKPTKWQDLYAEYMAFPRSLRIYDRLSLKFVNAERLWVLKALSRAEARGEVCSINELSETDRKNMYEALEHDMESIRAVVRDATKQKDRSGPFSSLRSLIDFNESNGWVGIARQSKMSPRKRARKVSDHQRERIARESPPRKISGRRMMISEAVARRKEMENT